MNADSGRIEGLFNALCSDRRALLDPPACPEDGAAIWARAGVVVEPGTGRLLVATGDGAWDGDRFWGDSVLELMPGAAGLAGSFTPSNYEELEEADVDLGSTAPAILNDRLVVQGGKEGVLYLLDLSRMRSDLGATGGAVQRISTPGGDAVFSAPAVLRTGDETWLFVANGSATTAYRLTGGRLAAAWANETPGTSPVVAGGLLYVFDPAGGRLNVYRPQSGRRIAALPAGSGHWNSPIVVAGRIALPEGDANAHETSGVLDVYRLSSSG